MRGTSGGGRGSLFLSSSETTFDTHVSALNVASDTVRGNALLANLRDALTGGAPVPDTGISKYTLSSSNKITYGSSEAATGVVFRDSDIGLRLVASDGFIAAGGTLLTAAIRGTFQYSGVFVSAASGSLGSALREGTFDLAADLTGGAGSTHYFTLDAQTVNAGGSVTSQLDVTPANGGTINATTGAFSATAASFIEGAGSTGGIPALVHGRILSAGQGVAGLFTTTQTGTVYAGGFVGGAPILARDIANPTNGLRIGIAREGVSGTSGHGRGSLFLSSSTATFDTHLKALNVASDTVRGNALLANLRDALTGGAPVPDTGISKYTLSSSNKITYGSSEATSGVVFGDSSIGLRLVAVDGFIAAGGTLLTAAISGTFRYSGAFVSAASGSLGSALREGTFDLVADLSGAANTHYFTLDAQTTDAGGAVTSQFDVTQANGVTIDAITGAFSATAASFIEGAGSSGGITALVHGRILSAGEGVAGLFTTTRTGTVYAGGFVGVGPILAQSLANPANGLRIGTAREDVRGTSGHGREWLFLSSSTATFNTHANALNVASDTVRGNALLANLRDALTGGTPVPDTGISKFTLSSSNKITYGSDEATSGVVFGDSGNGHRLVAVDGFIAAGGTLLTAAISGTFRYSGAFVWAASGSLGSAFSEGTFDLVAYLSGAASTHSFTLDARTTNAGGVATSHLQSLAISGATINATTGAFSGTDAIFIGDAGGLPIFPSGWIPALVHGRILSDGEGVAGLFTTTQAGTTYTGGFVGGAPIMARGLANPGDGLPIGIARYQVFSENSFGADRSYALLFLSSSTTTFDTHLNALNVASDTLRGNALLANLRDTLTGGAPVPGTGISKYTLSSSNKITYGSNEATSGVVFGDSSIGLRLVAVEGFIAAGGTLLTAAISGTFRYSGAFVSAASGSLGSALREGTLDLVADLSGAANTHYFTLDAQTTNAGGTVTSQLDVTRANGGTINATTGAFSSTLASFIEGAASTGGIPALVHGRILSGGEGVAGLFTTTQAGSVYAGGFVGGAPQVASDLYVGSGTTGNSIGQANRSVFSRTAHDAGRILFLGDNSYAARRDGLNVASDTARNLELLSNIQSFSSNFSSHETFFRFRTTGTRDKSTVWQVRAVGQGSSQTTRSARLFAFNDLFVVGGRALSGTLAGTYRYEGVFVSALSATLGTVREGTFTLSANFDDSSFTFTATTNGAVSNLSTVIARVSSTTQTSRLAVTTGGTVNASTGVLRATEAAYTEGTGTDKTADARLDGRVLDVGGAAVAGLFTTISGTATYVGGFVGGFKSDVVTAFHPYSYRLNGRVVRASGLGTLAERNLGSGTANGIAVTGADYAALVAGTAAAKDTTRNNAFLAGLRPTGFAATQAVVFADGITTHLEGRANTRTGGGYNSGGNFPATEWTNFGGQARIVLFDGSGVTGSGARGSFLVAGGASRPASTVLSGGFTWAGALVLGEADGLDGTPEIGRFTLRYNFSSSHAVKGSLEGVFADVPGNGDTTTPATIKVDVSITAASGRITNSSARQRPFALVAGATFDGVLAGYVSGAAAQGISGVFATSRVFAPSAASGTLYAGGFVGGAPILAQSLANLANGLRIGTAREDVSGTSGGGRGSLFLSSSAATFNTHANALNVTSDTARGDALLTNLRDALTGGAPVPDTGISKYTLSSSNKITYGSNEATSGVVFGDSSIGLQLVAVDGFIAAGGTLLTETISGTFRYSGAFVSAASSSLGSALREGTFDLVADLSGAASTHYFTLDAQTVNASGTVTSQLDVTQANGGTINATTGAFSSTAASFIEGAGSIGGIQALVHGRILSGGEGVAGLFTTTQAGTVYAGGFVGGGPQIARDLYTGSSATGSSIGQANRSVIPGTAHSAGRILFLTGIPAYYTQSRDSLNAASDTARNQHILSSLGVVATGGATSGNITKFTGVNITYSSPTIWQDSYETARLFVFRGRLLAGGNALSSTLGGTYRYEGSFVSVRLNGGLASNYGLRNLREGTFSLSANFTDGSFTFAGTTNSTPSDSSTTQSSRLAVTTGGTVDASTGVLLATGAAYTEGTGTTKTANARLDGRILGVEGGAVAGLFATTNDFHQGYVGGFVGEAMQVVARDLYTGSTTTGHSIGQANRSVFSGTAHEAGRILFLGDSYAARRDALNVASDTVRNQHILSSLGVGATGGTASGSVTKHTRVSVSHGAPATTAQATIWQDSNQAARLFLFRDLLVAGGKALSGTLAGTFQYAGIVLLHEAHYFGIVDIEGQFSLSANFDDNSFTFTSSVYSHNLLTVTTGGTVDASTGVLLATGGAYRFAGGTTNTTRLDGRILGPGGVAVAGLFTAHLSGSVITGGFVGGAPQIASDLFVGSKTTGYSIGQANRSVFPGTTHSSGRILFLGDSYAARRDALNVVSDTVRNQHILSGLGVGATGGTASGSVTKHTGVSVSHGAPATTAQATVWQDSNQAARLFAFSDLFVAGGNALSGTLAGTYQYEGVFVSASGTALSTLREGTFSLSANFTGSSFTFTGTTNTTPTDSSSRQSSRLAVTTGGTVNASTGILRATGAAYTEGRGADKSADARLDGRVLGVGGGGVAGLFTSLSHVGGFVGSVRQTVARDIYVGSESTGNSIGQANRSVFSVTAHDSGRIFFLGENYAAMRNALNWPVFSLRNQQILSNLRVTATGGTTSGNITKFTRVNITHGVSGRTTSQATIWQDSNQAARLFAFSDLFVAGGNALSGTLAGTYQYEGVFVSASGTALGTLREGTFSLSANFTGSSFTFTGTTNATPTDSSTTQTSRLAVKTGGTVDASTGVLLATAAAYTEGTGTTKTANARLYGRILGAGGGGVAGLFTSSSHVGGFIGSVRQTVARDIYVGSESTGNSIGQANRSVFSVTAHDSGRIFFLGENYAAMRNALNRPVFSLRNQQILSNLRVTATGGTTNGNITKFTRVNITHGVSGRTTSQATIWQDSNQAARLFAFSDLFVAGGNALSGTLAGTYQYEGVFVSASGTALGTLREGTFSLSANFTGSSFTFTGTTNATPTDSSTTQTSRLAVTTRGTVEASTGILVATAAAYTEGTGTDKSTDALLVGRVLGVGGGGVAGLFTTLSGTRHVGGFVGAVRGLSTALDPVNGRKSGLGSLAGRNLGPGTANDIAVVGDDYAKLVAGTTAASSTIRNNAFLAGLHPTGFGAKQAVGFADGITTHLVGRANTRTGGRFNSGGNNFPATEWSNFGGQARLVLFDGSGVTGSGARGSFLAAGGSARPAGTVLWGGFTWTGALVLGEADGLDDTPEIGRFTLKYDFDSSNAVKGSLEGAFADTPGNGSTTAPATIDVDVSIDAASGRIANNSAGAFALVAGATFDGVLAGYVSGAAAQGISGVFATSGTSGTQYAGGFVGGAPQVASDLYTGSETTGYSIGQENRARNIAFFLGNNYTARRDGLSLARDS